MCVCMLKRAWGRDCVCVCVCVHMCVCMCVCVYVRPKSLLFQDEEELGLSCYQLVLNLILNQPVSEVNIV